MPAGSVTVSASYNGQSILPAQPKADLDYSPKDGRFALDPADNVRLLTELIDNPDDTAALANPSVDTITYIAKFNRRYGGKQLCKRTEDAGRQQRD